ncbi:MAG: DUF4179 domain-containing protein [bacterium]|jgi:hypothetical protein
MGEEFDQELDAKMRELFYTWAEQGQLSTDRSRKLQEIVHRQARRELQYRWFRNGLGSLVAAVIIMAVPIIIFPSVRIWAAEHLPVVGKYIAAWSEIEKGWEWAEEHNMFQEVLASATDRGYTLRVHRVLADDTQTTVIYTVEGDDPGRVYLRPGAILFNGEPFVHGMGGRSDIIDGVQVESIEFDPLPAPEGELQLLVEEIGEVRGRWHVSFPVTRAPLSELTRTVTIARALDVPGGILTVEDMLIAPTQTVLRLNYRGEGPAPDLIGSGGVSLFLAEEQLESRGGSSSGTLLGDGSWEEDYSLEFQRSDFLTPGARVTIWLAGRIYREGETRLPLTEGVGYTPGGQEVKLTDLESKGGEGRATLCYTTEMGNPWLLEAHRWEVIDDAGDSHPVGPGSMTSRVVSGAKPAVPGGESAGEIQEALLELAWELPPGRQAVTLVNRGFWTAEELGMISFQISKE